MEAGSGSVRAPKFGKQVMGPAQTELIGIAMDITEQMRLAELSQTADQRLRDAIECVSEAFALWGSDGSLLLSNSKYAELAMLGRGANDNAEGATSELEAALQTLQDQEGASGQSSVVVAFPEDRWFPLHPANHAGWWTGRRGC
jgi:two-component system cell cycle sensor histidine kinase PleC